MSAYYRMETVHGYPLDESASALQKAIRRGLKDEACWWGIELNESGLGAYAWRRLIVISTEDVGMANPSLAGLVYQLYAASEVLFKSAKARAGADKERVRWNEEHLLQAVWLLAESPKSRELCDMYATITLRMQRGERLEIADDYLDMHTSRGRAMGRNLEHFNVEGDRLHPHKVIDGDKWGAAWEAERDHDK